MAHAAVAWWDFDLKIGSCLPGIIPSARERFFAPIERSAVDRERGPHTDKVFH